MREKQVFIINPHKIDIYVTSVEKENIYLKINRTLLMNAKDSKMSNITFNVDSYSVFKDDPRYFSTDDYVYQNAEEYTEEITYHIKVSNPKSLEIKSIIAKNFSDAIEKRGLLKKDVAEHLGVSSSAISSIINGELSLSLENLHILKEYFGINHLELLKGVNSVKVNSSHKTKREKELGNLLKSMKKNRKLSDLIDLLKKLKRIMNKSNVSSVGSILTEIDGLIDNADDSDDLEALLKTIKNSVKNHKSSKNKFDKVHRSITKI